MELLERFTPAHGLVDSALADMRERHAARERERLRREKQAQRQQQIAALTAQAGALARNRAVQGGAAALLVLVVLIASWSTIFPPKPIEPASVDTDTPASGAATPGGQPAAADAPCRACARPAQRPADEAPKETPGRPGATATTPKTPVTGGPAVPPDRRPRPIRETTGQPDTERRRTGPDAVGRSAAGRPGPERWRRGRRAARRWRHREAGTRFRTTPRGPIPHAGDAARHRQGDGAAAGSDRVEVAEAEIKRWIAEYTVAYRNRDQAQVRSMNRGSTFRAAQYKAASVTFSNVEIRALEDGQTAVLKADRAVSVRVQPRRQTRDAGAAHRVADAQDAERVGRQPLMLAGPVSARRRAVLRRCRR